MFSDILNQVTDKLTKLETDGVTLIESVYDYPTGDLKGDPAVVILPSGNEGVYFTTSENERIYAFTLNCYVSLTDRTPQDADRVMRNLVTAIIDDFDNDYMLAGVTEPKGYTFINIFATPSAWGFAGAEDDYRVAEINLKARVVVDVNQIS